jgi:hypothetical protein
MAFMEIADLAESKGLRRRITVCIVQAAATVLTTPKGAMTDAWYSKRTQYAVDVTRDPESISIAFVWPILADATLANKGLSMTDQEMLDRVLLVWDYVAGVNDLDKAVV